MIFDSTFLTDKLIKARLSNLARAIRSGVDSVLKVRRRAVQFDPEANGPPVFWRPKHHVKIATMEPEHDPTGRRFEYSVLRSDIPCSDQSPLIEVESSGSAVRLP